ncbi:MAG: hypothetical protein LBI66_02560 [Burkholderiaceae bacterium]|jgi:glycosyltransferase involved in cell wall biosynthesis|nr:hypothetical protein [Burkholderiaceae bacterium]
MRAIVLGTQSFIDGGTKVGTQYLAQALAGAGWQVDYVPTLSSPMDMVGRQRHGRLRRAWAGGGVAHGVAPGLVEWTAKAPFPAHRLFLRFAWQTRWYGCLLPAPLLRTRYDLCLADVAPNLLVQDRISARLRICRLNDWPRGFAADLHGVVMDAQEALLRGPGFDEIWAVSRPLQAYAQGLNARTPVRYMPNGVDAGLLPKSPSPEAPAPQRRARSAVYVGGMTAWLDRDLLVAAARSMPDWSFDIYGPGGEATAGDPPNLAWRGSVSRQDLARILPGYEVGLIPFRDADGRMRYVERPLKFYEYIAAGLGVASTDLGGLRGGMGALACYGNGVQGFYQAMEQARQQARARPTGHARQFVDEHAWDVRAQAMLEHLKGLLP